MPGPQEDEVGDEHEDGEFECHVRESGVQAAAALLVRGGNPPKISTGPNDVDGARGGRGLDEAGAFEPRPRLRCGRCWVKAPVLTCITQVLWLYCGMQVI